MTLSFELGDSEKMLLRNSTASNDAIWASLRATVRRMQDELWGYLGLAAVAGGTYPTLTLTPGHGSNPAAEHAAMAQVQRDRGSWAVGRGRMDGLLRGSGSLIGYTVRVCLRSYVQAGPLVGWETIQSGHPDGGGLIINPFTWFYANGTPSMRFSSERSRATFGPTMLGLHELTHLWGRMFASSQGDNENIAVQDVDSAMAGHSGVGRRLNYHHGSAGSRSYVDADYTDQEFSARIHQGADYVEFPNDVELQTGRQAH